MKNPYTINYFEKGKFNYHHSGSGKPLIFLPGYGLSPVTYRPILDQLSQKFQVISPYLLSGWQGNCLEDLPVLLKELTASLGIKQKLTIVGHSMGGYIVAKFAVDYSDLVENLIIVNGLILNPHKNIIQLSRDIILDFWPSIFKKNELKMMMNIKRDSLVSYLINWRSRLKLAVACTKLDFQNNLPRIKTPTLILWGNRDRLFPTGWAETIRKLIPYSKMKIVEGGHSWLLMKPDVFLEEFRSFTHEN